MEPPIYAIQGGGGKFRTGQKVESTSIDDGVGNSDSTLITQKGATDLVSEYNVSTNNNNSEYTFSQAVALVPVSLQKGGLTIKYIDSTTHEYAIKRLMSSTWNTTESNWQGVDESLIPDSDNLAKSGLVAEGLLDVEYGKVIREEQLTVVSGYYNMNGVSIGSIYSRPVSEIQTTKCLLREVAAGEVYEIIGKGISQYAGAYILTDSDYKVIDMVTVADYRTNPKTLYIGQSGYLYVNLVDYDAETDVVKQFIRDSSKSIEGLDGRITALEESVVDVVNNLTTDDATKALSAKQGKVLKDEQDSLEGRIKHVEDYINGDSEIDIPVTYTPDKYINLHGIEVGAALSKTPNDYPDSGSSCWKIGVIAGEVYKIYAKGSGNYAALYAVSGDNNLCTAIVWNTDSKQNGIEVSIAENGWLYVNDVEYATNPGRVVKLVSGSDIKGDISALDNRVTALEENQVEIVNNLNGGASKALSAEQGKVLNEKIEGVHTEEREPILPTATGKYINCIAVTVGGIFNPTSSGTKSDTCAYWRIQVAEGEKYAVKAEGNGNAAALYVLTGDEHKVLAKVGNSNSKANEVILNIEEDGELFVNDITYTTNPGTVEKIETVTEGGYRNYVDQKIADLETNPLKGKNIVFFGDSIITVKDSSQKDVTDYIAQKTGATLYNFAIGGTRLAQRNAPTLTPDSSTAWGDLDICNLITAACTGDYQYVDAGAEVITEGDVGDPVAQKIDAMKILDWSTIDIIVIEGGGNDYSGGRYLGTTDSFDKNNVLGAVNYIIQSVCTSFKKAKVIGMADTPGYRAAPSFDAETQYHTGDAVKYDGKIYVFLADHLGAWTGEDVRLGNDADWRTDDTWGDNAKNTRLDKTARELYALIEQQYHYYHLPYANMYECIGWNQYNFSEYFLDTDNHHPRKGLSQLADGIISHLENLVK